MDLKQLKILLADDDTDDCLFFRETVEEILPAENLSIVHDGEQLMQLISGSNNKLPHVLFLDLNMPRKNGFECLSEIKADLKLQYLTVIVFSTSFEHEVVNELYKNGAQYFIRKPSEFLQFKTIIQQTLSRLSRELPTIETQKIPQPLRENFVLTIQNEVIV